MAVTGPGPGFHARPYQVELLEKAKAKNIIVYLGTGSGKTFIAIMLIKHMRDMLLGGKKVVFLVNNVALLEQQAEVIRNLTGLPTGSYCGADGVDNWNKGKWKKELQMQSVMVFIHQVFLDALAHGFISMSSLELLVIDECHHAVGNHPYSKIMNDWYHESKVVGNVPKVLGLTASIVVKAVQKEKFRQQRARLEETLDATVETAEGISLEYFVKSAREKIVYYERRRKGECEEEIANIIIKAKKELWDIKSKEISVINNSAANINSKTTSTDSLNNDFKSFKNDVLGNLEALLEIGVYCLASMEDSLIDYIENKCRKGETIWYNEEVKNCMATVTLKYLKRIIGLAKGEMLGFVGSEKQRILRFSGGKFLKLVNIIQSKGSEMAIDGRGEKTEMRCIVFVERKLVSQALQYMIWKLQIPTVTDVGFCFSASSRKSVKDPREREIENMEKCRMKDTLARFRSGIVNVLVSTSVVEEGIDVPSCNLVVKYDFPQTFRSYIQSKGRARKADSQFIVLVEEGDKSKEKRYEEWLGVYKMSMEECHPLRVEDDEDDEQDEENYSTSIAKVSGTQALVLLNQYLQKIPVDRYTRLTAAWTIKADTGYLNQSKLYSGLGLSSLSRPGYLATVHMPHKTPFTTPVHGKVRPRKVWAKRSAALEIVRLLHQMGELDDSLKVRKKEAVVEDDEDNDSDLVEGQRGSRKFYRYKFSPLFATSIDAPMYLHTVQFKLVKRLINPRYRYHVPQDEPYCLGLLTTESLPSLGPLEIFSSSGTMEATVTCLKRIPPLSKDHLQMAIEFHEYLFSTCLALTDLLEAHDLPAPIVVPVLGGDFNLNDLDDICRKIRDRNEGLHVRMNTSVISPKTEELEHYQNLVIYPIITPETGPKQFFIEEISEMRAESLIQGMGMTFAEYYKVHLGLEVKDTKQHVLRISSANRQLYMLESGGEPVSDGKPKTFRSFKVAETMGVEPISAGLWMQAQMLPWVLYRINSLLTALPFTQGWSQRSITIDFKNEDVNNNKQLMEFMISKGHVTPSSPSPGQLVQALTLSAAGDRWDMERLEILGDAFFKFSTTVFLYYTMPDTCDEGDLTLTRSKFVGNQNFLQIAIDLGLAGCGINSSLMNPAETWSPPGYQSCAVIGGGSLEEKIVELDKTMKGWAVGELRRWITREDLVKLKDGVMSDEGMKVIARQRKKEHELGGIKLRDFRLVSDKSQADCIEAMTGCYLLNCGMMNTLDFLARIGINLSKNSSVRGIEERKRSEEKVVMHEPQKDAFCNDGARNETKKFTDLLSKLGVHQIEEIIGYQFKEKSFLLQAFTHPSYEDNRLTWSYEKLEFLGDAVLDYLVTCYVYTNTEANPGSLTDIRSALVCNNMFASNLTDFRLDHFILHCTHGIYIKIKEYLEDRCWSETTPKKEVVDRLLKQLNEDEPLEIELVEVPKVLGDVFEALFGAIFLDSGHDLEVVWKIYRNLCPSLDEVIANPPLNMKKQLLEKFPATGAVVFSNAKQEAGGGISVSVSVTAGGKTRVFKGKGRTKKLATLAACKCALRILEVET